MLHCGGTSKFQHYVGSCQIMTIIIMIVIIIIIIIIIIIFFIKNNLLVITKLIVKTYLQSISLKKKKKKYSVKALLVPSRLRVTNAMGAGGDGKGKGRKTLSLAFHLPITPLAPLRRDRERDEWGRVRVKALFTSHLIS